MSTPNRLRALVSRSRASALPAAPQGRGLERRRGRPRRSWSLLAVSTLSSLVVAAAAQVSTAHSAAAATGGHVIVSFTFDDGRVSQYAALPVFANYGMHATFYMNTGLMGTSGIMTWAQLHDIAAAGHEIGGHTLHHTGLTEVDPATARAEIQGDITNLQAQGFPRPVSFAFPYGYYGTAEEGYVRDAGYTSARTTDVFSRESNPPANAYALRIPRPSLDGSEGLAALQRDVTAAEAAPGNTWLVYLMHEFYSPIDEEIGDFLAWLKPRAASGTVVKTVGEVMTPTTNQPPVANAGSAQTVTAGSSVQLDGSGSSDPNGDPLTYQWTQTGGTPVTLSSSTAAKPTFTAPASASTLTFQLVVNDGKVNSSPSSVTITVTGSTNGPPVANAGSAQTVTAGSSVQLDGSGSSDPNGDPLTYQWTQTGGTPVTLSSSTAAKPTFTAPASASTLTFQLVVNDGKVNSSPSSVTITVTGSTNGPPVANAGSAQTVTAGSSVQLDGSGSSDPNGDPLTYQWTQTGGTPVTLSSSTAAKPTFTAPASASTLTFQLVVNDGKVNSSPSSVTITVQTVTGPTYRSSSSTGNDAYVNAVNVPVPSGAAAGDVVVAAVSTWGTSAPTVTAPSGFTLKATYTGTTASGGADTTRIYWKRLTAADTGSYRFSWSGSRWAAGQAVAMSGAATSGDPIETINRANNASATGFPSTSVTTGTAPLLVWFGRNDEPAAGTHTPPTAFTEVQDRDCSTVAYQRPGSAGTNSATGASYSGPAGPVQAILVAAKS